jgi:hypothetical protein
LAPASLRVGRPSRHKFVVHSVSSALIASHSRAKSARCHRQADASDAGGESDCALSFGTYSAQCSSGPKNVNACFTNRVPMLPARSIAVA